MLKKSVVVLGVKMLARFLDVLSQYELGLTGLNIHNRGNRLTFVT